MCATTDKINYIVHHCGHFPNLYSTKLNEEAHPIIILISVSATRIVHSGTDGSHKRWRLKWGLRNQLAAHL